MKGLYGKWKARVARKIVLSKLSSKHAPLRHVTHWHACYLDRQLHIGPVSSKQPSQHPPPLQHSAITGSHIATVVACTTIAFATTYRLQSNASELCGGNGGAGSQVLEQGTAQILSNDGQGTLESEQGRGVRLDRGVSATVNDCVRVEAARVAHSPSAAA